MITPKDLQGEFIPGAFEVPKPVHFDKRTIGEIIKEARKHIVYKISR